MGEGVGKPQHVLPGSAQGAEGEQALTCLRCLQQGADFFRTGVAQLCQQPDGARGDVGIVVFEQSRHRLDHRRAECFQSGETEVTGIDGWALQRGDLAFGGGQIQRGNGGFESLGGDPVNGTGAGVIQVGVAAGAGIIPVGDIDGAVGSDAHAGRAEEEGFFCGQIVGASDKIGAFELAGLVGGDEVKAFQLEGHPVGFGEVTENRIAPGFAAEQEAPVFVGESSVFVIGHAGGRAAAIDIASGEDPGVVLPPLGGGDALAGALVSAPLAFAVLGEKAQVGPFEQVGDAAGWRVIVVILKVVAKGSQNLLIRVAEVMAEDACLRAIWVHAGRKAADVNVAIVGRFAGPGIVQVAAADAKGLARFVGEVGSAVAIGEIPAPVGSCGHRMQGVVMLRLLEAIE